MTPYAVFSIAHMAIRLTLTSAFQENLKMFSRKKLCIINLLQSLSILWKALKDSGFSFSSKKSLNVSSKLLYDTIKLFNIHKLLSISQAEIVHLLIHSGYFYSALKSTTTQRRSRHNTDTVPEFHAEVPQATVKEGLAQGPYAVARAGVEPMTLRTKGVDSANAPPTPQVHQDHRILTHLTVIGTNKWLAVARDHKVASKSGILGDRQSCD